MASSISLSAIYFLLFLIARSAASLRIFSICAPVNPGILFAKDSKSISGSIFLFLACIFKMAIRSNLFGTWKVIIRSNRPGLKIAASRTSNRLVAPIIITLYRLEKPSISTNNWLRVCSRSSLLPVIPIPRFFAIVSISSINKIHGEYFLAVINKRKYIALNDIDEAIDRTIAGLAKKTKKYNDYEKKLVAYHESGHALSGLILSGSEKVEKITIIPRGKLVVLP